MASVLGIDLGGTNIKLTTLTTAAGELPLIGRLTTVPTDAERGPALVIDTMVSAALSEIAARGPVAAIGVGTPGLLDAQAGTIGLLPNFPGPWPGYPMRDRLQDALGLPVVLINDARAFSLAEARLGAGRGHRTIVCVTLGTGVGGAVVIDGRLHLGATGTAGEIGHQTVLPDGPMCGCGNRGCAEPLVQAEALARRAGRRTAAEVFAAAEAGDARCLQAIEDAAGYLGIAIANMVTVLVPDVVVIGGGMIAAGDLLLAPIRAAVLARTPLVPSDRVDIRAAALGQQAGAIGAALHAIDVLGIDAASSGTTD